MMKILVIIVVYLIMVDYSNGQNIKVNEIFTSSAEQISTKILNEKLGNDVILKCKDHDKTSTMYVHSWKFAQCDDCDKMHPSELTWKDLKQRKRLHLKNITMEDRGRYICVVHNSDNIITVASYELRLSDHPNLNKTFKFIGRPPEIIDIEKSDEIRLHENVAVKCKVFSPIVPHIWWVKQCEEVQKCKLHYDGKFYYKINETYQEDIRSFEENVYEVKLHLRNFTEVDNGLYVCVTMSELGEDYRNFTLSLLPIENDNTPTTSLNLLFLIPFVFISIPICIDCIGKRIGVKRHKQEVVLLEVLQPSTTRVYHC